MSASERMIVPRCLVGAPKWMEQLGSGICAVETDGRPYRITQPNLQYKSGRGKSQVGLIYVRDSYTFCAFIGNKADDLRSWFSRQYKQEETDREKAASHFI